MTPFYARRETPVRAIEATCGALPPGGLKGYPALACTERPKHETQTQHRNDNGDVWGVVLRAVDLVPEARR